MQPSTLQMRVFLWWDLKLFQISMSHSEIITFRMAGIALIFSSWLCLWWSYWPRASLAFQCSDLSVCWGFSSWQSPGSLSTTFSPSWWTPWELSLTSHSSCASSSSSSPWWGCSCSGRTTRATCASGTVVPCRGGTSRTSCTASWLSSVCCVESG